MKGNPNGQNHEKFLQTLVKEYGEEIEAVLVAQDPDYRKALHIKPLFWMDDLIEHPEKYPKLSQRSLPEQKRFISFYLKSQGRVPASNTRNARGWVLPGYLGVTA
jgi:autonomous glycyl radical cofactor GrcA